MTSAQESHPAPLLLEAVLEVRVSSRGKRNLSAASEGVSVPRQKRDLGDGM